MSDAEITAAAKSDPDNAPLSKGELAGLRRGGLPPLPAELRKQRLTVRLDPDIIARFKAVGRAGTMPGCAQRAQRAARGAAGEAGVS
jgi:hypothetical protein